MRAARRHTLQRAYRSLLTAAASAEAVGGCSGAALSPEAQDASLVMYVRQRVRQELDRTRQRALAKQRAKTRQRAGPAPLSNAAFTARIDTMYAYAAALSSTADVSEVAASARALSLGVGSEDYRLAVEASILSSVAFHEERAARREVDDDSAAQQQNAVMLQALLPFAEKLATLHRDDIDPQTIASAMTARRSTTQSFFVDLTVRFTELLHVDVDDQLGKQTVYIRTQLFDSDMPAHMVETRELPGVGGSAAHAEWSMLAERYIDALESETPVHPSRATVLVGHGVGGAVALCMGLMLASRGYAVRNVVSFGAPMAVSRLRLRHALDVNPVRVALMDDARCGFPSTDDNREAFFHVGEALHLDLVTGVSGTGGDGARAVTTDDGHAKGPGAGVMDDGVQPSQHTGGRGKADASHDDADEVGPDAPDHPIFGSARDEAEQSEPQADPAPAARYAEAMSAPGVVVSYSDTYDREASVGWEARPDAYDTDFELHAAGSVSDPNDDDDGGTT